MTSKKMEDTMEIIETIGLITINETLFFQLISFLIFLFIINRLMFRPLRNTMIERDIYIAQIRHDIRDAEYEMNNIISQLKEKESSVRSKAIHIREETEKSGDEEADKIFASARKEIVALREKTRKEIDAQIANARKDLPKEAEVLAINIMEKILGRRLTS